MHDRLVSRRIDALHQCFLVVHCSGITLGTVLFCITVLVLIYGACIICILVSLTAVEVS